MTAWLTDGGRHSAARALGDAADRLAAARSCG